MNQIKTIELKEFELFEVRKAIMDSLEFYCRQYLDLLIYNYKILYFFLLKLWKKESAKKSRFSFLHNFYQLDESILLKNLEKNKRKLSDKFDSINRLELILLDKIGFEPNQEIFLPASLSYWDTFFVGLSMLDHPITTKLGDKYCTEAIKESINKDFCTRLMELGLVISESDFAKLTTDFRFISQKCVKIDGNKVKLGKVTYMHTYDDDTFRPIRF